LESLDAGDVVSVFFEENGTWSRGIVQDIDLSWPQPFGVEFEGDSEIYWISLDDGVKLLDDAGHVVAGTPDVVAAVAERWAPPAPPAPEPVGDWMTLAESELRPVLEKRSATQLHELLMEIQCPPKSGWRKAEMIQAFFRHRGDRLKSDCAVGTKLADFLSATSSTGESLLSAHYRRWMSRIDKSDQAHANTFPEFRIMGGHERAFVFHLITVLFVNARAAHLDLSGTASATRPKGSKDYIKDFIESRRARRGL
jgi:hypothetical protein